MTELTGRCMCGQLTFAVSRPLVGALYCHCRRCQRRSGADRSIVALTEPGSFRITGGEDVLKRYEPEDGWIKSFCSNCGSHTHTTKPDSEDMVAVRLGCIDQDDPGIRPAAHQFVDDALSWEPIPDDGLPRYPARLTARLPEA